jgi:hypothetical protein
LISLNDRKIIGCRKNILSIFVALLTFYNKEKRRKYHILKCQQWSDVTVNSYNIISPLREGGGGYTVLRLSVQDIFRRIFLGNCWWQKCDIWSQASYRYPISWEAFLDPSDSYFLFADLVGFYTHWTYMHILHHIFLSNCWWQRSDIWSKASYRYPISWEAFLDPSDSYFLFADLVGFYTHWTYMHIFRHIFLSNYWWQRSDIWSQASYRYPILWEVFFDPSDSYFLFAEERGYQRWALAHSSSCFYLFQWNIFTEMTVFGNL